MHTFLAFIAHKHFFLAAAFGVYTCAAFSLSNTPVNFNYAAFVAVGTLSLYNMHRLRSVLSNPGFLNDSREQDAFRNKNILGIIAGLSAFFAGVILVVFLFSEYFWLLLPAILIGVLYTFPVIPRGYRLKDIPFVKLPLIALTVVYLTTIIPQIEQYREMWPLWISRFLFVAAITLPFDIRDTSKDRQYNIKTLATTLGQTGSSNLAIGLMCIYGFMGFWVFGDLPLPRFSQMVLALTAGWIIYGQSGFMKNDFYYAYALEGLLLAEGLVFIWLGN